MCPEHIKTYEIYNRILTLLQSLENAETVTVEHLMDIRLNIFHTVRHILQSSWVKLCLSLNVTEV